MRKISDTIARLAALKAALNPNVAGHGVASHHLQALRDFGSNPGALRASYYLPVNLPKDAPLVVVLHGCTQTAAGYDHNSGWSQFADEEGFALLFPEQQRTNNANLCFNWFQPDDARRGAGEVLSIREMIEAIVVTHNLDRESIFITGLSAGGAMAAVMLATYPEVFAGGGVIAGLPYGSATTIPEAFDRMRGHGGPSEQGLQRLLRRASAHEGPWPRISIWQGSADNTVAASNAEAIAAQWRGVHKFDKSPTYSMSEFGRTKRVWCDPAGQAKIEINLITGMGHGTPIGGDGLGNPGPFILDVGISSTREIARFWGIAQTDGDSASVQPGSVLRTRLSSPAKENAGMMNPTAMPPTVERHAASDRPEVQKVIEDALRTAGLMR